MPYCRQMLPHSSEQLPHTHLPRDVVMSDPSTPNQTIINKLVISVFWQFLSLGNFVVWQIVQLSVIKSKNDL